ncbi:endonuclease NucS [Bacillus anthracis]|uniref:endonuclease NucS domain-containing protein n=1 Tax=Bacillus anthracis TaxID=1392 RepID=UPI0022716B38|nr:endonuclease NucS domain-containing protein [Bacillus anthracis]MCX9103002.1 endonuclease NucS [Bacillus anthracis]
MGVITKNGDNIIDFDLFTVKYGCIKVEFKQQEGERYYLYAFRNDLTEWDFDKGELILVTHNEDKVKEISSKVLTLYVGEVFCKECFRKKDIEKLSNKEDTRYWCHYIWKKTPLHIKKLLQDEILHSIDDMDWSMVRNITTEKSLVFFGICSNFCMTREEYNNNDVIQEKIKLIDIIWEELIADEIMNGPESLLEDILCDHIEVIEEGMSFVERQYKVENGIIDIIAKDENGTNCIIELKVVADDKNLAWQSAYYPSCFEEDVRMITIAPNYSTRIYNALKNISNVEMKFFCKDKNGKLDIKDFNGGDSELEVTEESPIIL